MRLSYVLRQVNLSFCGCGFLVVYQMGAAKCLLTHGAKFLEGVEKFAGTSAGSLVATLLTIDPNKINTTLNVIYDTADEVRQQPLRSLTPGFRLSKVIKSHLDQMLPDNAHKLVRDKMYVSVTNLSLLKNSVYTDFGSKEELIECILCSCFIPVYDSIVLPKFRDMICVDGSYTANLYRFPTGRTIAVTPFSGEVDISPVDPDCKKIRFRQQMFSCNIANVIRLKRALFPPPHSVLEQLHNDGYEDAARFLKLEGLYSSRNVSQL